MSLYKRKDSSIWWVRFTHKGTRIQQSSGTSERIKAEEYEAKLKASLWEQERLGVKPIYQWNDAVVRYLRQDETQSLAGQRYLSPALAGSIPERCRVAVYQAGFAGQDSDCQKSRRSGKLYS